MAAAANPEAESGETADDRRTIPRRLSSKGLATLAEVRANLDFGPYTHSLDKLKDMYGLAPPIEWRANRLAAECRDSATARLPRSSVPQSEARCRASEVVFECTSLPKELVVLISEFIPFDEVYFARVSPDWVFDPDFPFMVGPTSPEHANCSVRSAVAYPAVLPGDELEVAMRVVKHTSGGIVFSVGLVADPNPVSRFTKQCIITAGSTTDSWRCTLCLSSWDVYTGNSRPPTAHTGSYPAAVGGGSSTGVGLELQMRVRRVHGVTTLKFIANRSVDIPELTLPTTFSDRNSQMCTTDEEPLYVVVSTYNADTTVWMLPPSTWVFGTELTAPSEPFSG